MNSTCSNQLFSFVELQVFLFVELQLFLYAANFKCSYCCELQLFLLRRTNFLFTSLYPVSRVYTTLSTLDSALRCNSEIPLLILILWLCLPNILKESSPYFLIFCINLFTTSTINSLAGNRIRLLWTASDHVKLSWKNFLRLLWTTLKSCNRLRVELNIYNYISSASCRQSI